MNDLAAIITASVGLLAALGGGARFVWNKIEARFARVEAALEQCHERELRSQTRRAVQLTVIELLWQEVQRLAPRSKVLDRARHHFDELKKIDEEG